jgi:LacI family gluconate utilization system Gnt-I transcriptional repressor
MTATTKAPRPRTRSTGRITLADVAEAAGVSLMTASRALRADRNVGEELVARVRQAAKALNYIPDPAARSLASSHSRNVIVLVPLLSNLVFGELIDAVQVGLLASGYHVLFGVTHYNPLEEERLVESYLAFRPAALILSSSDHTRKTERLLAASKVPTIQVMEIPESHGGYAVGFSQSDAGRALTQHLLDRGRRRIAFIGAQLDPRVLQRMEGYRDCLRAHGLYNPKFEILDPRSTSVGLGQELLERALALRPRVDAIFFCNDDLAQGALLRAPQLGITVPDDLAIAGFNDLEGSAWIPPGLTTIRTPRAEIGRRAAQLLVQVLEGRDDAQAPHAIDLGFELVVRGST